MAQSDYVPAADIPPTVYESEEKSPQNMDFDTANNMFVAHAGWYNDQLIHVSCFSCRSVHSSLDGWFPLTLLLCYR